MLEQTLTIQFSRWTREPARRKWRGGGPLKLYPNKVSPAAV